MSTVIKMPVRAVAVVINELEKALEFARRGKVTGIALSYMADGEMFDCAEANDYMSAINLLGQSNMLRLDIMDLAKKFRDTEHEPS